MNIFVLSRSPVRCARMHCDKHVVKMMTEYVQILSVAVRLQYGKPTQIGKRTIYLLRGERLTVNAKGKPVIEYESRKAFAMTHAQHPCTVWSLQRQANWDWLYELAVALADEYTYRYGKEHASARMLAKLKRPTKLPEGRRTRFALAMPEHLRSTSAVAAYRSFYMEKKRRFATWKKRKPPSWWQ